MPAKSFLVFGQDFFKILHQFWHFQHTSQFLNVTPNNIDVQIRSNLQQPNNIHVIDRPIRDGLEYDQVLRGGDGD